MKSKIAYQGPMYEAFRNAILIELQHYVSPKRLSRNNTKGFHFLK